MRARPWLIGAGLLALSIGLLAWGPRNLTQIALHRALLGNAPSPLTTQLAQQPDAQAAYALGLLAQKQGQIAEAERWYAQALSDGRYLALTRQQLPQSAALAQQATALHPAQATAWEWLGDVTVATDPAAALAHYQNAAQLSPLDNLIWEKVGQLAQQQNNPEIARNAYQHACDLNPVRNGACLSAAHLAYLVQDWALTIEYYERGGYPESVTGWVELIRAAQQLGQTTAAARYRAQAEQEYPADYAALLAAQP